MNLRSLAKEYANGVLGLQDYRKARDELIEGILAGNIIVTAHNFQPPLKLQRTEADATFANTTTGINLTPPPQPSATSSFTPAPVDTVESRDNAAPTRRGLLFGLATVIILLVIAIALYPFTQQKISTTVADRSTSMPGAGAVPVQPRSGKSGGGVVLIKQFLKQTDWSDQSLQQFMSTWQGLSAEARDAGLSSSAKTELANAIYRKLQEERIMQGLGDVQTSMDKQATLVSFAQQMGINDSRIVVKGSP